jgi:hypothetical protein
VSVGDHAGIVSAVEPLLGEHELRLVKQLTRSELGR